MTYDIAAAILLAAVLVVFQYKKSIHRRQNLYFLLLVICLIACVILHACNYALEDYVRSTGLHPGALNGTGTICLLFLMTAVALFSVYMAYALGLSGFLGKKFYIGFLSITGGIFLLLALNPLTHWFFSYDKKYVYHREFLMPLFFVTVYLYLAIVASHIIRQKALSVRERTEMMLFVLLILAGLTLQALRPNTNIAGFLLAVATAGLLNNTESAEHSINSDTGLKNGRVLVDHVSRLMHAGEKTAVIAIHIINLRELSRAIALKGADNLEMTIASWLDNLCKNAVCYQYEENIFVLALRKYSPDIENSLLHDMADRFQSDWQIGQISVVLQADIRVFRIPEDCASIHDFVNYLTVPDQGPQLERVKISHAKDLVYVRDQADMKQDFLYALQNHAFVVYYQPLWNCWSKRSDMAEALVRIKKPDGTIIMPQRFIEYAERTGDIYAIGLLVLENVCRFVSDNHLIEKGITHIDVNLSGIQCMYKDLVHDINAILEKYHVPHSFIIFEITETTALYGTKTFAETIRHLREDGYGFALDDYGTGYSNISTLYNMQFTVVKLDKDLLWRCAESQGAQIVLKNSIRMLRELGVTIVQEGVETQEQLQYMLESECDEIQGYYFSKPIGEEDYLAYIRREMTHIDG
ncbi:MAG: EAL domain-containing protein [Bilifractor sp.]